MSERKREFTVFLPENVYKRIVREVSRERYITPYTLAEKYNMTVSLAKRVIKRLVEDGVLKLHAYNRRAPIYVPAQRKK